MSKVQMATASDWLTALRLKTLSASVSPVIIGSAYAHSIGEFRWLPFFVILFCASSIQIVTNFINEIYDFKKGADNENRLGSVRSVSTGAISSKTMKIVSALLMIITFIAGLYLVSISDYYILLIGILSLLFSWAYTGGPYPLAYNGLGDVFVLLFFGLVAVCGTFYVYAGYIDNFILASSFVPGILSMNILSVNNIRDIETDKAVNKNTLAVKIGAKKSIALYVILTFLVFVIECYLAILKTDYLLLLPLITIPLAAIVIKKLILAEGREYNKVLALTALLMILNSALLTLGILIGL